MKTVIIFDVDNTIYNNKLGIVPPQTLRLLDELSKKEDVILGLATGRGFTKLDIVEEVLHYFQYKILINGSVVYKDNQMIYDYPIKTEDIKEVIEITKGDDFNIGMVGIFDEAVNYWDERVSYGMKALRGIFPKVDENYYLNHQIYQLWMFADEEEKIINVTKRLPKFKVYPWHKGGADLVYEFMNKAYGIKIALKDIGDYQLICVGDGANDIQMIEMADIGIAMNNTRFSELKEKADFIAPHIMEDQLYDFFKSIHLI
jgi:Cof subfamily protein (haloacid dehalogenase superfamily)